MTRKDFYNAVIEANISEDMNNFAEKELTKLAHEAEYRRNTPTKKQRENMYLVPVSENYNKE